MMKHFRLTCLLMLCAFAAMAQSLTCTFQFTGTGTIGTHTFTNATITITTVGDLQNRQSFGSAGDSINNTSASISISGLGVFALQTPLPTADIIIPPNAAPGATIDEQFMYGAYGVGGSLLYQGYLHTSSPWHMLSSIGPITTTGVLQQWNGTPISTSGGTVNIYSGTTSVTFQATVTGGVPTSTLTRSGVLSHIAAGGGWTTVITLVNNSSTAVPVTVVLHDDYGNALNLPVTTTNQGATQTTNAASVSATIKPNATLLISTGDGIASTAVGWADVLSSGPVGGFAIFRQTVPNSQASEGTVPLISQFPTTITLPYDDTTGFVMGVALANLSTASANVTTTIWDDSGNQLGTQYLTIAGSGHASFVLPNQLAATAGRRGIVQFQSSGGLAGLGLRFSPFGTFTSVPMI